MQAHHKRVVGLFCVLPALSPGGHFCAIMSAEHDTRWLRSRPTDGGFQSGNIDAENGIIRDVVMVQEGEAKGHDVFLEGSFISDIVKYDNKHFSKTGVKARFGHPGASSETMGTQMGAFHNFRERQVGGKMQAIADLHLLDSANESPTHPGMRDWMLKMAAERPDFVMSSIVFKASYYYQKAPDGTEHVLKFSSDPFDGEKFSNHKPEYGNVFVKFGQHYYTDMVEAGAATESLFSNQVNSHLFVAQADEFLQEHPNIKEFIKANPDKVTAFFASLGIQIVQPQPHMQKYTLWQWLSGEASAPSAQEDIDQLRVELNALKTDVQALKQGKEAAENRVAELTQELTTATEALRASQEEVRSLNAQIVALGDEVELLKQQPAGAHPGGQAAANGTVLSKTPVWDRVKAQYGIE